MTRRNNRRRQYQKSVPINVEQIKEVQGPQLANGQEPRIGRVELDADLAEKYLGRGLIGFGPYLEVLPARTSEGPAGRCSYSTYRLMLEDSEVDASLDVIIQAASSQPLTAVSPLSPDDPRYELSQELTTFVNWSFGRFDIDSWRREQLRQALAFGNAVSEIDWEYEETGPWANHFVIKALRLQRPEDYGFIVDRWGTMYGVAPLGQAAGLQFPLGNLISLSSYGGVKLLEGAVPLYKLTVWTFEQRGMDPRGNSILIPSYIPWWSKQRAIEEWACWLGRYAQPSLWATPGPDALPVCVTNPDGTQIITQPTEALLQALLQFKSASVLALPYGSKVELLSVTGGVEPFLKSIEAFDKQITRAILGQHLATGEGSSQNKAGAEIHAVIFRLLVSGIRKWIALRIGQDIIKPLIEANYGDVGELMPVVDLGDGDGFPITATEVAVLFQAGYFSEDQLSYIDKVLGLPVRKTNDRVGPSVVEPSTEADNNVKSPVPPSEPKEKS